MIAYCVSVVIVVIIKTEIPTEQRQAPDSTISLTALHGISFQNSTVAFVGYIGPLFVVIVDFHSLGTFYKNNVGRQLLPVINHGLI